MRKLWSRIPIRLRAVFSLILVLALLLGLWGATGWAWPTPLLAFRAVERSHAFGPGEILVQEPITYGDIEQVHDGAPDYFMVSRAGDNFQVLTLNRRLGFLWAEGDLVRGSGLLHTSEQTPLALWTVRDFLSASTFLEEEGKDLHSWREAWEQQVVVCSSDPSITDVEVTLVHHYRFHRENELAAAELDVVSGPVRAQPVGEGVYLARLWCEEPEEAASGQYSGWGRSQDIAVAGYDGAGTLVWASEPEPE